MDEKQQIEKEQSEQQEPQAPTIHGQHQERQPDGRQEPQQKKTGAFGGATGFKKPSLIGEIGGAISKFIGDSKRIFIVSKKPTMDEYKRMALVVALGIAIIGVIGYIITLIFSITGIGF
ncbi:MAG: protein translocase SEC61 complex subunit gamma [Candidatus Diapherotrites archaeon]|nr:protein translocase SEC61 complex subunit gamma [Candidatus Diapherotrites archaeon]